MLKSSLQEGFSNALSNVKGMPLLLPAAAITVANLDKNVLRYSNSQDAIPRYSQPSLVDEKDEQTCISRYATCIIAHL